MDAFFVEKEPRPVCRGGNYFDVPGNARCAVLLGIRNTSDSDSRDGFRICLGPPVTVEPSKEDMESQLLEIAHHIAWIGKHLSSDLQKSQAEEMWTCSKSRPHF